MGTVMVDFITSLDGYASAEGWPGFWGVEAPDYLAWLGKQPDHTLLMGANTYRLMSGFAEGGEEGVDALTHTPKVVFSTTLQAPLSWSNTRLISADAVETVRAMKEEVDTELRTVGSLSLCRALVTAGLVDRFRVVAFPFVTGVTGRERIYDGYPDLALELVDSRTFDGKLQRPRCGQPKEVTCLPCREYAFRRQLDYRTSRERLTRGWRPWTSSPCARTSSGSPPRSSTAPSPRWTRKADLGRG